MITCTAFAALKAITGSLVITGACPAYMSINGDVTFPPPAQAGINRAMFSPIVLDFSGATAVRLDVDNIHGPLEIDGFNSKGAEFSGMNVILSSGIKVEHARFDHPGNAGIQCVASDAIDVGDMTVIGSGGDGIDLQGCTNTVVHDGAVTDSLAIEGHHPDCVQQDTIVYDGKTWVIGSNTVQNMTCTGNTMGLTVWEHQDFGAHDLKFLNNHIAIAHANGIAMFYVHGVQVIGNDLRSLPGSITGPTSIRVLDSTDAVVQGNFGATP